MRRPLGRTVETNYDTTIDFCMFISGRCCHFVHHGIERSFGSTIPSLSRQLGWSSVGFTRQETSGGYRLDGTNQWIRISNS